MQFTKLRYVSFYAVFFLIGLVILGGCSPFHEGYLRPGDLIELGKISPQSNIEWRLIREKVLLQCMDCHAGRSQPNLNGLPQVREHLAKIWTEVQRGSMPPKRVWYEPLSACKLAILKKWADLSAPISTSVQVAELSECVGEEAPKPDLHSLPLNFQTLKSQIIDPRCSHCHSAQSGSTAKTILFDTYELIAQDAKARWESPGNTSRIIRSVTRNDKFRMPPSDYSDSLNADEIDFIVRWIDAGKPAQ